MRQHFILDAKGEPVATDMMTWARWFENHDEERSIARTSVGDEAHPAAVSTVFLGLDHQYALDGPPLIFETMVFGGPLDGEMERYSTRAQAIAGHEAIVERCKSAPPASASDREAV